MSDSDNHGHSSEPPPWMPPEVQQQMREQYENIHALNESNVRRQDAFIEGLDEDQLRMFRGMVRAGLDEPDFGNYMIGWISAVLKIRYNVCQHCGNKHETFEDLLNSHPEGENRP